VVVEILKKHLKEWESPANITLPGIKKPKPPGFDHLLRQPGDDYGAREVA